MDEEQKEKPPQRIGYVMAILLLLFAGFGDAIQFVVSFFHVIPVAGNALAIVLAWFIAIVMTAALWIWFLLLGVFKKGKQALIKILVGIGGAALEFIPIIDALPGFTGSVIATILLTWYEDGQLGQVLDLVSTFVPMGKGAKAAMSAASQFTKKS